MRRGLRIQEPWGGFWAGLGGRARQGDFEHQERTPPALTPAERRGRAAFCVQPSRRAVPIVGDSGTRGTGASPTRHVASGTSPMERRWTDREEAVAKAGSIGSHGRQQAAREKRTIAGPGTGGGLATYLAKRRHCASRLRKLRQARRPGNPTCRDSVLAHELRD